MLDVMFPPAVVMLVGALLAAIVPGRLRGLIALLAPLLTLALILGTPDGVQLTTYFLGYDLTLVEGSALRRLFAATFAIMAFGAALFGLRHARWWELSAGMAYAGGAIGVSFAGDMVVLFIFWEMMALVSTVIIWSGGTDAARRAGLRYVILHLLGGILFKVGIEMTKVQTDSFAIRPLGLESLDSWLVLAGILVHAAAPPVSYWLSDAYPESSPTGGVWLSAFTTKTAVLSLILLFPGAQILITIGIWMIFYGIVYALLENDLRRVLSYSIVNQMGFMVAGVGIGTPLALNGVAAHAVTHVFFVALLFMVAGSVIQMTGKRKLTELGGLYRGMPITTACALIGAVSISAFPLTSGFVSMTMIGGAAAEARSAVLWFLLVAGSAGVFLHAGMKFSWYTFFHRDSGVRPSDPAWNMRAAMIGFAAICIAIGVYPDLLYSRLPYAVSFEPYSAGLVVGQLQLLLFAGLAFFVMLPMIRLTNTISLDWDWLYRRVGGAMAAEGFERARAGWTEMIVEPKLRAERLMEGLFRTYGPYGPLARSWPVGSMVLWVGVLLTAYLVLALF